MDQNRTGQPDLKLGWDGKPYGGTELLVSVLGVDVEAEVRLSRLHKLGVGAVLDDLDGSVGVIHLLLHAPLGNLQEPYRTFLQVTEIRFLEGKVSLGSRQGIASTISARMMYWRFEFTCRWVPHGTVAQGPRQS